MLEKIRSLNLKKAGYCAVTVGIIGIIVHALVIVQIIPYTWINGGRTTSYLAAKELSVTSIILISMNILLALVASKIIKVKLNRLFGILLSVFLIATLPFGFIGIIQQFLGTVFEKCIMSIVTIIGFVSDTRIALEKRW